MPCLTNSSLHFHYISNTKYTIPRRDSIAPNAWRQLLRWIQASAKLCQYLERNCLISYSRFRTDIWELITQLAPIDATSVTLTKQRPHFATKVRLGPSPIVISSQLSSAKGPPPCVTILGRNLSLPQLSVGKDGARVDSFLFNSAAETIYLLLDLDFIRLPSFFYALYTHVISRFIVNFIHTFFR